MRYKQLGNSSLKVSVVGQGTWALGNDFFGEVDVDQGIKAIQAAIDVGINMVDTARSARRFRVAGTRSASRRSAAFTASRANTSSA
jgi:diketogulonate reductase-like aldo/keto reductase